ncbi:MAG: hypothetical protein ACI4P0_00195, partial [Mailhella sp.]
KANKDSVVFNMEEYLNVVRRILGMRLSRHLYRKEVIIEDPDYAKLSGQLETLAAQCRSYSERNRLGRPPHYINIFFRPVEDHEMEELSRQVEEIVEELSNTRDLRILNELNHFPILLPHAHVSPFGKPWMNRVAGVVFPIGMVLWGRMWRFRLRLGRDLKQLSEGCTKVGRRITEMNNT